MAMNATSYARVQRFIAERCVFESDLFVTRLHLYDCYCSWSRVRQRLPLDVELFKAALGHAFEVFAGVRPYVVATDDGKETRGYLGVGLSDHFRMRLVDGRLKYSARPDSLVAAALESQDV